MAVYNENFTFNKNITANALTASQVVVTDASKIFNTVGYSSVNTANFIVQRDANKFILCDGIVLTSGGIAATTKLTLSTTTWQFGGTNSTITEAGVFTGITGVFSTTLTSPLLDSAAAVEIGKTNATSVNIGRSTKTTTIKGILSVAEAATFDTTLKVAGQTTFNNGTAGQFTMPTGQGSVGQLLITDGSGGTAWSAGSGGVGFVNFSGTVPVGNAIARYNGVSGTLIQAYTATGPTIDDNGIVTVNNATESSSYTTGAMIISGGFGVAKKAYFKSNVNVDTLTASYAVVTDASKNLASLQYTNANTASTLVQRDASGNFSAGTITANLTGNCSGSSGSCTGNAATSSSCTGNAATCTTASALSGNCITDLIQVKTASGTMPFKNSAAATFGVYDDKGMWVFGASTLGSVTPLANSTCTVAIRGSGDTRTTAACLQLGDGASGVCRDFLIINGNDGTNASYGDLRILAGTSVNTTPSVQVLRIGKAGDTDTGVAGVGSNQQMHGYISANGGGTSGTATTQHPYLAIKTIKTSLDTGGACIVAHGISNGGARIAFINLKVFNGNSAWVTIHGLSTSNFIVQFDDVHIVLVTTDTAFIAQVVEFFISYEAS